MFSIHISYTYLLIFHYCCLCIVDAMPVFIVLSNVCFAWEGSREALGDAWGIIEGQLGRPWGILGTSRERMITCDVVW